MATSRIALYPTLHGCSPPPYFFGPRSFSKPECLSSATSALGDLFSFSRAAASTTRTAATSRARCSQPSVSVGYVDHFDSYSWYTAGSELEGALLITGSSLVVMVGSRVSAMGSF